MASPPEHPDDEDREIEEILTELRQLRSVVDRVERRRRRMVAMFLAAFLVLTPTVVIAVHLLIDYESGRVAQAIERSSGPFTDEALRRVCQSIKIPLFRARGQEAAPLPAVVDDRHRAFDHDNVTACSDGGHRSPLMPWQSASVEMREMRETILAPAATGAGPCQDDPGRERERG